MPLCASRIKRQIHYGKWGPFRLIASRWRDGNDRESLNIFLSRQDRGTLRNVDMRLAQINLTRYRDLSAALTPGSENSSICRRVDAEIELNNWILDFIIFRALEIRIEFERASKRAPQI
jgi:hypothetical protein